VGKHGLFQPQLLVYHRLQLPAASGGEQA